MKGKKLVLLLVLLLLSICGCKQSISSHGDDTEIVTDEAEKDRIAAFIYFFTDNPVLYSFDQDNTSAALRFSLYKLEVLNDVNLTYDETHDRYYVPADYVKEFMAEYFDIEELGYYSNHDIRYRENNDTISFVKCWQQQGSYPIIDTVEKRDDRYFIKGHLDVPKPVSGYDGDIAPGVFEAEISENAEGKLRMYAFEIHY